MSHTRSSLTDAWLTAFAAQVMSTVSGADRDCTLLETIRSVYDSKFRTFRLLTGNDQVHGVLIAAIACRHVSHVCVLRGRCAPSSSIGRSSEGSCVISWSVLRDMLDSSPLKHRRVRATCSTGFRPSSTGDCLLFISNHRSLFHTECMSLQLLHCEAHQMHPP